MPTPLVSICTTTYNHARYIRQTLDGFLSQKTDFDFEILVHDDVSTDGTIDILKEYAERYPDIVKPIFEAENQYSKNIPINETFNFPRALGKYIALCEGDDYWIDEGKLQAQADFMESHPDCTFCFTNGYIEDESGVNERREFVPYYESERPYYRAEDFRCELDKAVGLSFVPTASFFFPRNALERVPRCFHDKMCQHGDLKMRLFFTALGYGQYLHRFSCAYRQNVAGSAFAVWSRESAEKTAARAATVSDMLRDVDEMTKKKYTSEVSRLRDRYLYVELWNTQAKHPLKSAEMKRIYRALPLKRRVIWRLKRVMPRRLTDFVKGLAKAKKV